MPLVQLQGWFNESQTELHLFPSQVLDPLHCPQLGPELAATIDGRPLQVVSAGSSFTSYDSRTLQPHGFCMNPVLRRLPEVAPEHAVSTIELSDASGKFTVEVTELFAPRKMRLLSPADGRVRAGDKVTVGWSTPSDHATPEKFSLYTPQHPANAWPLYDIGLTGQSGVLTEEGPDQWSFTMPEQVRTGKLPTGPITLTCNMASDQGVVPAVPSCAQFASCHFQVGFGWKTDIALDVM